MVHVSEHLTSSQPPSWTPQHSSGYRVQDDKGQMGLAITPQNLPEDQSEMGSICSGPVCIQTHTPTASIFQLETRSSGSSDRCLPSSVAITDEVCKPSLGSNIESPIGNQPPTSRSCDCSSSLEESVLVSSSAIPTIRLSPPHNISTRSTAAPGVSVTSIPAQEVQLAVWPTSGISVKQKSFQNKLQNSSWHHGEISPQKLTTHSFTSGSAGVFNGTEIPFLVL